MTKPATVFELDDTILNPGVATRDRRLLRDLVETAQEFAFLGSMHPDTQDAVATDYENALRRMADRLADIRPAPPAPSIAAAVETEHDLRSTIATLERQLAAARNDVTRFYAEGWIPMAIRGVDIRPGGINEPIEMRTANNLVLRGTGVDLETRDDLTHWRPL